MSPRISVLTTVFDPEPDHLEACLRSVGRAGVHRLGAHPGRRRVHPALGARDAQRGRGGRSEGSSRRTIGERWHRRREQRCARPRSGRVDRTARPRRRARSVSARRDVGRMRRRHRRRVQRPRSAPRRRAVRVAVVQTRLLARATAQPELHHALPRRPEVARRRSRWFPDRGTTVPRTTISYCG